MDKPTYSQLKDRIKYLENKLKKLEDLNKEIARSKKRDYKLRQSEEHLKIALEAANVGLYEWDMQTRETYYSEQLYTMLGYESVDKSPTKETWINQIHPADREATLEIVNKYRKNKIEKHEIEFRTRSKSSGWCWILSKGKLIKDKNNQPLRVIGIYIDITERKKAEENIRFLSLITENISDSIIVTDTNYKITYINKATEKLFGYSLAEIKDKRPDIFNAEPQAAEIQQEIYNTVTAGKTYQGQSLNKRKDGSTFPCEYRVMPLKNDKGKIISFIGIQRDVSRRRKLEEQLQIRQRMDSLGTLAGGMAHDFNNILVGIMGNIDMLLFNIEGFDNFQKQCLKNAMLSCKRAASLVSQFQVLSRGDISMKTSVDIYDIAREVFNILAETTDRLIKKRIDFNKGEYYVLANPSDLNQVFLNLATNAVQAIEEQGIAGNKWISIRAEEQKISVNDLAGLSGGEYVHIIFKDNGRGMSDQIKKRAFDPLFTTKEKGTRKGQGLGLAIVYNIITQKHQGNITIESKEGKGTTFHIHLPKTEPWLQKKAEPTFELRGGNETILVIEDEDVVLNLVKSILEKYQYNVLLAENGKKGLEMFKKHKKSIDLVILDLTMPEMSGQQVFEKVIKICPQIKVIISSGHSQDDSQKDSLHLAKAYVKKPYKLRELLQTVREVLDA